LCRVVIGDVQILTTNHGVEIYPLSHPMPPIMPPRRRLKKVVPFLQD
jgi:hypothetical protein